MKLKIKVKMLANMQLPQIIDKGEWVDLRASETTEVGIEPVTYIPLGVAIQLPKGFEAIVVARSSTPMNFHIWCPIGFGVIDNSYCSDTDQWHFPATTIGVARTTINRCDRICQFRIQPSQKATVWQKLRWLLSSGIELVKVESLDNHPRGGFGSTGKD